METTPVITPRESSDEKQEASTPPPPAPTERRTRGRPRRVLTEEEIAERRRKKQTLYKDYNKEYHLKYYHAKLRKEMECPYCHLVVVCDLNMKLHQSRNLKCLKAQERIKALTTEAETQKQVETQT